MTRPFDKCPVCGAELAPKTVEKILCAGNHTAVVQIDADVCLRCGERLYTEETVNRFEQNVSPCTCKDVPVVQVNGETVKAVRLDFPNLKEFTVHHAPYLDGPHPHSIIVKMQVSDVEELYFYLEVRDIKKFPAVVNLQEGDKIIRTNQSYFGSLKDKIEFWPSRCGQNSR